MKVRHPITPVKKPHNWPRPEWLYLVGLILINSAWTVAWWSAKSYGARLETELSRRCSIPAEEGKAVCGLMIQGKLNCSAVEGTLMFKRKPPL